MSLVMLVFFGFWRRGLVGRCNYLLSQAAWRLSVDGEGNEMRLKNSFRFDLICAWMVVFRIGLRVSQ